MKKINPDIELKAKEFIENAYKVYSDRSGLETNWDKWNKLYNSIPTEKFYEGAANLFPPEIRRACKTLINFADEVLFNSDPPFQVKGVGGSGDSKKAIALSKYLEWQQHKIGMRAKIRAMIETLVKYGFIIVKVPWVVREKYILNDIKERQKIGQMLQGEDVDIINRQKVTIYDNIDFQVKNPRNIFWNYYDTWENQTAIIEKTIVSWEHLKTLEASGIYYDVDRLKEDDGKKRISEDTAMAHLKSTIQEITGLSDDYKLKKNQYELLECWCNFDIDGDGLDEECVITLAGGEHIIRLEPNPYNLQEKPYLWVAWDALEGTSLGVGVPQLAERSQIALNDFTNQIMDNITQILNCMKVVDDLAEIPDIQLKSRPNGVIRSKTGTDAVEFLRPPDTATVGLRAVAMVKEDIRQISGATVSLQGLPARYGTTATEAQQQASASARDVFAKMREIEDRIIKEFLRKAYHYNIQFLTREDFIKVIGEEAAISPIRIGEQPQELKDLIGGEYDFIWLGVSQIENKVVKAQQLINFLNIAGKLPPGMVDLTKVVSKIWKAIGDGDDIMIAVPETELVNPNDENILMAQGETPRAKMMENHSLHIQTHAAVMLPVEFEIIREQHIAEHQNMLMALQQQQAMAQQQQAMAGGGLVAPQEQPHFAPETITPETIARITQ